MADEKDVEVTEDDIREAAARVEAEADNMMTTAADEPVIITETAVVEETMDGDEVLTTVEEQVVEVVPESAIETAPDMPSMEAMDDAVMDDMMVDDVIVNDTTMGDTVADESVGVLVADMDESEPEASSAVAVYPAPDEDEFVVVEGSELVVVGEAADEPDEELEGFTTVQALSLAFLVLLNIIVIGLGIWQVSLYFGWL